MSDREQIVDYAAWDHVTSASQYESFHDCHRKWWWKSCIKLPRQEKDSTIYGNIVHGVIERWASADDSGRGADGKPVDLYPPGWADAISPKDAAQVKALVQKAIEAGILVRRPGRKVEAGFVREVFPGVAIQGFIDLSYPDTLEVEDHKTTKRRQYVKTPDELKRNPQLLIYARIIMDLRGAGPEATVSLRHNTFVRESSKVIQVGPVNVNGEAVLRFWEEELVPTAREMLALKQRNLTEEQWRQVPGPADEDEVCHKYGGCDFLSICSGRCSPAHLRATLTGLSSGPKPTGAINVPSIMDQLLAAGGKTTSTAAATVPAAPAPAPVTPTVTAPAPAVAPVLAAAAVVSPPAARAVPPWAQPTCNSCGGLGFAKKTGQPCFPCDSMARAAGKQDSGQFTVSILPDGIVLWRNNNGSIKGDQPITDWQAPKAQVIDAPAPVVTPAKPTSIVAAIAAAAPAAPAADVPQTTGTATNPPAVDVPVTAEVPAKRGRGRPKKSVTLPTTGPLPGEVAALTGAAPVDIVASANLGSGTVPPVPVEQRCVIQPTQAAPAASPRGFVIIIGATQVGGINVSQVASRDLSDIIRTRLAPQVEAATGKQWWAMPVYERRDALLQKAREISQTLSGVITVDPSDGEAGPLARALIPFADGAFISNR